MSTITTKTNLYNHFINSIKSEVTKNQYIYALNKYMKYYSYDNIEQLLGESKEIQDKIINYIIWMRQDRKLSYATIQFYVAAVAHFYAVNDIILNRKRIGMYLGEYIKKQKDRAYTAEEIHRLLEFCDERSKSLVLLLASTGIRIGAIPALCLSHIQKIDSYQLYKLIVYESTKEEYFTFTTSEAAVAIDNYLDYRNRCGEKLAPDSPLFRKEFDPEDLGEVRRPKRVTVKGLSDLLDNRLHKSGLSTIVRDTENTQRGRRRNEVYRAHGFRKFVTTNMIRAKLNPEARQMLLGHKLPGNDQSYYKPDEEEVLEEYLRAVDFLTINAENRLRREVETLKVERSKIEELTNDLLSLKNYVMNNNNEQ